MIKCDALNKNLFEQKNVIIPSKYINVSNVHHTVDSLYLKLARAFS